MFILDIKEMVMGSGNVSGSRLGGIVGLQGTPRLRGHPPSMRGKRNAVNEDGKL